MKNKFRLLALIYPHLDKIDDFMILALIDSSFRLIMSMTKCSYKAIIGKALMIWELSKVSNAFKTKYSKAVESSPIEISSSYKTF